MLLNDYRPRSRMKVHATEVAQPRFDVIDAHDHLGESFGGGWEKRPASELLDLLDEARVKVYVDLDGAWGENILQHHLEHFKAAAPERFVHAGGVDWFGWETHGSRFGEWAAERMRQQAAWGAQAFKVWKTLGTRVKDEKGQLVIPDDPRLDPIWAVAGELKLPMVVHIADPVAFFDPIDATNERWEELQGNPDWQFTSPPFPPFLGIVNSMARVVERFPQTMFVGAHVGWYAEDLGWVSDLLERCPNFYIDIGARVAELGRQPYTARRFFNRWADRILFGTDAGPRLDFYRIYYRFLETEDEYFNPNPGEIPHQGRWFIYGLGLEDEVLQKVYFKNAQKVFGAG